jgi:hypothetical protein
MKLIDIAKNQYASFKYLVIHLVKLSLILKKIKKSPYFPSSKSPGIFATIHTLESTFSVFFEISKFAKNRDVGQSLYELKYNEKIISLSSEINTKMDHYGSDKGTFHGYSNIYSSILNEFTGNGIRIAEIGIGTNNTKIPSNMGTKGIPGASLRAWNDISCIEAVYGLDVDRQVLVNSDKISSFYLDQLNQESWNELENSIEPGSLDIFIDDGLHSPLANIMFLNNAHKFVKQNGFIIIEDIDDNSLSFWEMLLSLHSKIWDLKIIRCKRKSIIVGKFAYSFEI